MFLGLLLGNVKCYDMPICEKGKDNVCYKDDTSKRACNGYIDLAKGIRKPVNIMDWKKRGKIEYLIVKDKFTFSEAMAFCEAICSKLFVPMDYYVTKETITYDFWSHGLGPFYIGLEITIDNEEHITIYSAYDNSTALPKAKYDSFMDSFFLAGLGFKAPGTFPLVITREINVSQLLILI